MKKVVIENLPDMNEARKRVSKSSTILYSYTPSKELIERFKGKKVFIRNIQ